MHSNIGNQNKNKIYKMPHSQTYNISFLNFSLHGENKRRKVWNFSLQSIFFETSLSSFGLLIMLCKVSSLIPFVSANQNDRISYQKDSLGLLQKKFFVCFFIQE